MNKIVVSILVVSLLGGLNIESCQAGRELYMRAAQSLGDSSARVALGLAIVSGNTGPYVGLLGEVGGIVANRTGLDYRLETVLGWRFIVKSAVVSPHGVVGYRQFARYEVPASSVETVFGGGGLRLDLFPFYLLSDAIYMQRGNVWQPYAEVGVRNANLAIGGYYEQSPDGGSITGLRYGVLF